MALVLPPELTPAVRAREAQTDIESAQNLWQENRNVVLAALVAGLAGRYTGRRRASFENTVIGGIYAGFSAVRDPRTSLVSQLLVAFGQGVSWGLTDVYVPVFLDWVSGRAPSAR